MLKKIVFGLLAFVVIVIVVGFLLPSTMHVEQSIVINAAPEKVFPEVGNLRNWNKWTTWAELESDAAYKYSDNTTSPGSFMKWDGKEIGKGELTFMQVTENQSFKYKLYFPDFESTSIGTMTLSPSGSGTKVMWIDDNDFGYNIMMRYMGVLFIKSAVDKDFAKGLSNLKRVCETN